MFTPAHRHTRKHVQRIVHCTAMIATPGQSPEGSFRKQQKIVHLADQNSLITCNLGYSTTHHPHHSVSHTFTSTLNSHIVSPATADTNADTKIHSQPLSLMDTQPLPLADYCSRASGSLSPSSPTHQNRSHHTVSTTTGIATTLFLHQYKTPTPKIQYIIHHRTIHAPVRVHRLLLRRRSQ